MDDKSVAWDVEKRSLQREKERLERNIAELEERWQYKLTQAETDLAAAKHSLGQERDKAARIQSECKQSISRLEQTQAEELHKSSREAERQVQRRQQELDLAKDEARSMKQEAAKQEHESQEAWRWLSRVEYDLKIAQKDLRSEQELARSLQQSEDGTMQQLKKAHEAALQTREEEGSRKLQQSQAELRALRWELQEAHQNATEKLSHTEQNWSSRLRAAETEASVGQQALQSEMKAFTKFQEAAEQQMAEARQAKTQLKFLEDRVASGTFGQQEGGRSGLSQEAWQQKVAEAEARGAAGVDLATKARVEAQRAEQALRKCRQELEEAKNANRALEEHTKSSAEALERACTMAAQAEVAAEARGGDSWRQSEQAWRSVASNLEAEVAALRHQLNEERLSRQLSFSPVRSPSSPLVM